jgi:flavin reductase (DIM6/NTAB) family NADH-FMN oxidoreductase RutF
MSIGMSEQYRVKDATVSAPPNLLPDIYFGDSSDAARPVAARGRQRVGEADPGDDHAAGERLRQALRQHPAGVVVVTAGQWRRPVGLTVTTFTSVSLSPPLVSLLVARSASVWPAFERSTRIGVHLLPAHASELATTFARHGVDPFTPATQWVPDVHGVPVLQDAGVRLSCVVHQLVPIGEHVLVIARVESAFHPEQTHEPLVWHDGGYAGVCPPQGRPEPPQAQHDVPTKRAVRFGPGFR